MQKVKLSTNGSGESLARQTPKLSLRWNDFQFYIKDTENTYDWFVVYDGLSQNETVRVRDGHTIFLTGEPPAIKIYNKKFLDQFDLIITSQPNIQGKNVIHTQTALAWTLYQTTFGQIDINLSKNYDDLKNDKIEKTKLLSVVTSNKNHTKGHRDRLEFIYKLQQHFGDKIDVFGPGLGLYGSNKDRIKFKYHENKWEALASYKYHIAIENSQYPDYWTEKLTEAFVAETYPFYFGCPNIFDYFNGKSLTPINILKPEEAIEIIERKIEENTYEKSLEEILKAKNLILEKYQLFPMLEKIFETHKSDTKIITRTIHPEIYFQDTLLKKTLRPVKHVIKSLLLKTEKTDTATTACPTQQWIENNLKPDMVVFEYVGNTPKVYDVKEQNNSLIFQKHIPKDPKTGIEYGYTNRLDYFPDAYFDLILIQNNAEIDDSDITLANRKIKSGGAISRGDKTSVSSV